MTVTTQRREDVATAVEAFNAVNAQWRRAGRPVLDFDDPLQVRANEVGQQLAELDVTADEVAEIAAGYELARDRFTDQPDSDTAADWYRESALMLHYFRSAHRWSEVASGRRAAQTAMIAGGVDFGAVAATEDPS